MGILLVLYLFDFSYWGGCIGIWARRLFVSISMVCMVAGAIVSAERFTYMPAAVYVLGLPFFCLFLRKTLLAPASVSAALSILGIDFGLASLVSIAVWVSWVAMGNMWNAENREDWKAQVNCEDREYDQEVGNVVCLAAFMLWFSPLIIAAVSFVFCASLLLVARSVRGQAAGVQARAQAAHGAAQALATRGSLLRAPASPAEARAGDRIAHRASQPLVSGVKGEKR